MIWTENDVESFLNQVSPPGYVPKGFYDGISFIAALAFALNKWPGEDEGNAPLLEALREKYPEAVETYLPEAERSLKEALSELQA